jgi:hypothetical protein
VRADPGFEAAHDAFQVSSGATVVQDASAGGAAVLAGTTVGNPATTSPVESVGSALASGVLDVAPTLGEALGAGAGVPQASVTSTASTPPSIIGTLAQTILFDFRLILRLP